MNARDLRAWLAASRPDAKERLKVSTGHGGDTDDQFVNYFIAQPALQQVVCDALGVQSQADRVAEAAIAAPRRDRIAIYISAASMIISVIGVLISLLIKSLN